MVTHKNQRAQLAPQATMQLTTSLHFCQAKFLQTKKKMYMYPIKFAIEHDTINLILNLACLDL